MGNPIEQAREAMQQGLKQLPGVGLRLDYALELRRYPDDQGAALDMDPNVPASRGTPEVLAIEAPNVKPLDRLSAAGAQALAGGIVQAGDLLVTIVRTAAVEAFLKARRDKPASTAGGPYPELSRVEFWINGEVYRAVYCRPKAMTTAFTCRRQAAP